MRRGPGNELTLCLCALMLAVMATVAGCGGGTYSNGPNPQPVTTSGTAVIYPESPSVPVGSAVNFLASAPGQSNTTFKWSVTGSGTIDSSTGIYKAGTSAGTATVTATGGNFTGTVQVTVTSAPANGVTMSPAALFVEAGSTVPITALSNGQTATVTEWDVHGTQNGDSLYGFIDNSGNYTAPLTPPPGGTTTITAKTAAGAGNSVVTVVFSNASLNGPYAFSYAGKDTKGFLEVAGSFTANGAGGISNLIEDESAADIAPKTVAGSTGTFSVGPDGTGTATISDSTTWDFVVTGNTTTFAGQPAQKALLLRFDKSGSGSGTINQQNSSLVSLPMPFGPYAFLVSQPGTFKTVFAAAGKFQSSGLLGNSGALTPGVWDVNSGGIVSTDDTSLTGSFSSDTNNPGSGRGTLTLTTTRSLTQQSSFVFAFYVIDSTHLKVIETDGKTFSAGDVYSAPNTNGLFSTASLSKGNYPFTTAGQNANGAYSQGGVFISSGSGSITGGVMDVNGGSGAIFLATITQTTYTVDPALGRIQFSITSSASGKTVGTWNFAGYQTASGALAMVETDSVNVLTVVSGTAYAQTSNGGLQGGYAATLTGTSNGAQEDIAGQFVVGNTSVSTGTIGINLMPGGVTASAPITQALVVAPDTNGRGTATIYTKSATFALAYYVIDQNTALMIEADAARNVAGSLVRQF